MHQRGFHNLFYWLKGFFDKKIFLIPQLLIETIIGRKTTFQVKH